MKRVFISCLTVALVIPGVATGVAVAQTDMSKFSLIKAVPADVFITIAGRANSEREFLDGYWGEVTTAFMNSGILTDIWDLVSDSVPDEQIEEFENISETFSGLCKKVKWGELFEKEMLFTQRFQSSSPGNLYAEGVVLGRLDEKGAAANYVALKSVLEELGKFIEAKAGEGFVTISEIKRNDITISTIGPAEAPGIGVSVAVWKDIIIIGYGGSTMIDESIALLNGTSKKPGLVSTPRFKAAFAKLPPAEDTLTFFDMQRMLGTMRGVCTMAGKMIEGAPQGPEGAEGEEGKAAKAIPWIKLVGTILDDVAIIDSIASVEWTDGYRVYSQTATSLRDGAKSSPLYDVIAHMKGVNRFARHIPKEAVTFQVSSGIDLVKLYDYLIRTVKDNVPGGEAIIAQFDQMQEAWELDIKKDVLSLIEGSTAFAQMGKDWVVMVAVTNEKKAEAQVDRLLGKINKAFGENALMITTVQVGKGVEFKQLSHPMMMMMPGMSPPVLGCADGYFMVGSSARTIRKCLKTAAGEHPNITKSKRWQAEALIPKGAVTSISFTDESKMAEELQAGIGVLSMGMGMVGMFAGAGDVPAEVQGFLTSLPPILAKLGPVVGKLDFYKSSAAYETFDGQTWHSYGVQNYKTPQERRPAEVQQVNAD